MRFRFDKAFTCLGCYNTHGRLVFNVHPLLHRIRLPFTGWSGQMGQQCGTDLCGLDRSDQLNNSIPMV